MDKRFPALFAALLLAAPLAAADSTIYKIRTPDGRTVYSQDRSVRGKVEDVLRVQSPPVQRVRQAERERAEERKRAAALQAQRLQRLAAESRLRSPEPAIAADDGMPASLYFGSEPLPGERIGIAGGGSRLTDAYWIRQQLLDGSAFIAGAPVYDGQQAGTVPPMMAASGR